MTLDEYLKKIGKKPTPWAKENGISTAVISRYFRGHEISLKNILRISAATNGEVPIQELLKEHEEAA